LSLEFEKGEAIAQDAIEFGHHLTSQFIGQSLGADGTDINHHLIQPDNFIGFDQAIEQPLQFWHQPLVKYLARLLLQTPHIRQPPGVEFQDGAIDDVGLVGHGREFR
jgi:hypothetical protein